LSITGIIMLWIYKGPLTNQAAARLKEID